MSISQRVYYREWHSEGEVAVGVEAVAALVETPSELVPLPIKPHTRHLRDKGYNGGPQFSYPIVGNL